MANISSGGWHRVTTRTNLACCIGKPLFGTLSSAFQSDDRVKNDSIIGLPEDKHQNGKTPTIKVGWSVHWLSALGMMSIQRRNGSQHDHAIRGCSLGVPTTGRVVDRIVVTHVYSGKSILAARGYQVQRSQLMFDIQSW